MTMLTQLPFYREKFFQQFNFFMLKFIVSKVYIARCVEYLDYLRQNKVPNLSRPV